MQRARLAGLPASAARLGHLRDQRYGTALGMMRAWAEAGRPGLTERQYQAGEALARLWSRWAALAAAPPRCIVNGGSGTAPACDDREAAQWERIDGQFRAIRASVWRLPAGVPAWRAIETLVMDDAMPSVAGIPGMIDAMGRALDEVAVHLRIATGCF